MNHRYYRSINYYNGKFYVAGVADYPSSCQRGPCIKMQSSNGVTWEAVTEGAFSGQVAHGKISSLQVYVGVDVDSSFVSVGHLNSATV